MKESRYVIGNKIFNWTVISHKYIKGSGFFVDCTCECGVTKAVSISSLSGENPRSKSCGCLAREMLTGKIKNPLKIGDRFTRLVVIGEGFVEKEASKYPVRCDCGTEKNVRKRDLVSGTTKSCGCLSAELSGQRKTNLKHGMSNTSVYNIWATMKARCTNPNSESYSDYGGRGITVCDKWLESFENFYADMGDKPFEDASIERLDFNKGYSPENCVWADKTTQMFNRRKFKNTTSEYIGVHYDSGKNKPWRATLKKHGEVVYLASFYTEIEAAEAYDEACLKYYGVRKNFPDKLNS
jgi:hypothetical protein